jgi:hypothetical protein
MGLFGGKKSQTVEPITFDQAIAALGLPPGTILRESEDVLEMWCPQTDLPRTETADCYRAELLNMGNSVVVSVAGKAVGRLDDRSLPTAVLAFKRHGGQRAPAVLFLGREGRRTDKVLVRK